MPAQRKFFVIVVLLIVIYNIGWIFYYSLEYRTVNRGYPTKSWSSADDAINSNVIVSGKEYDVRFTSNVEYIIMPNICLTNDNQEVHSSKRIFNQIVSFDASSFDRTYQFNVEGRNFTWTVKKAYKALSSGENLPVFVDEIAAFPCYWKTGYNFYNFIFFALPRAYETALFVDRQNLAIALKNRTINLVVPQPVKREQEQTVLNLKYKRIIYPKYYRTQPHAPRCFKYGIFQDASRVSSHVRRGGIHGGQQTMDAVEALAQSWQRSLATKDVHCRAKYALFLQRARTRRVLNISELADAAKAMGYGNVIVAHMENKTMFEQWKLIRCASLFVTVQGAGASWLMFLPKQAVLVELSYPGWHNMFTGYAKVFRPDITALSMTCQRETPDAVWRDYAQKWFNYSGPISDQWMQRISNHSTAVKAVKRYASSVWKDSDCACSPDVFRKVLKFRSVTTDNNSLMTTNFWLAP